MSGHGRVIAREQCPKCNSADNVARHEDGYARCWTAMDRCGWYEFPDGYQGDHTPPPEPEGDPLLPFEYAPIPQWKVSAKIAEQWNYGVGEDAKGKYHVANEVDQHGNIVSQKVRREGKEFRRTGKRHASTQLFGATAQSSRKRIVVTEGEKDALAVAQAHGGTWPVVSIPDGAPSALRALAQHAEWLDTFEDIVLLFDTDTPGQEAAQACAEELGVTPGKVRVGRVAGHKDAAEAWIAGESEPIIFGILNAKPFVPGGVVEMAEQWNLIIEEPEMGLTYPWEGLSEFLHGMRAQELATWCAGSGIGKSAFVKEVAYHLATKHDARVGIVALEEGLRRTMLDLISLRVNRRLADPEIYKATPRGVIEEAFKVLGPKFCLYDHFGSMDDASLLAKLRWMASIGGCKWIILDHVSIVVSGMSVDGDERKRIDKLMTDLRSFVQKTGVGLHLVSHLRRQGQNPHEEGGRVHLGDLRGSQAIAQLSDLVIGVERNQQHANEFERNVSLLRVLKNRTFGDTGPADQLYYNKETGRLIPRDIAAAQVHFGDPTQESV